MKKLKKKFLFIVEKNQSGFSIYSEALPVYTTAKTSPEIYPNILEALNLYLEDYDQYVEADNIKLQLDLQQFFQYYKVLNAKYLAKRIGMNETLLSQYVQGRKKPSPKQQQQNKQQKHHNTQTNKMNKYINKINKNLHYKNHVPWRTGHGPYPWVFRG